MYMVKKKCFWSNEGKLWQLCYMFFEWMCELSITISDLACNRRLIEIETKKYHVKKSIQTRLDLLCKVYGYSKFNNYRSVSNSKEIQS